MSKGSWRRPTKVNKAVFDTNWYRIFGNVKKSQQQEGPESEDAGQVDEDRSPGTAEDPDPEDTDSGQAPS